MAERDPAPELRPGDRLGPYEIGERIGAGGMGEVYRARDSRLERSVAIKILAGLESRGSTANTSAADLRVRFQREARSIAQLQHPNICALFDIGEHGGRDYLVLELLDGEPLDRRLSRGPLPFAQVLALGAALAEALAAAHARGILHRDIKPGNVMLTRSGPKLLDFGLAKLRSEVLEALPSQETRTAAALTAEGTLVGTLAYMAPEQLEGKSVDERADLWALGCVLYEMAAGERAFQAATPASTIAAILDREPRVLSELAPLAPRAFDRLVGACLAKDPEERWRSSADLARELRWIEDPEANSAATKERARRPALWLAVAPLALGLGLVAGWQWNRGARDGALLADRPAVRAVVPISQPGVMPLSSVATISPDGRRIVISTVSAEGRAPLEILALDSESHRPLAGTEGAAFAFWSPDSRSIAYFQGKRLKRLDVGSGPGDAKEICALEDQGRGGSWSSNGTIVFSGGRRGALLAVPATGGAPRPVTTLDPARREETHRWPQFLPDGERFLYWASRNEGEDKPAIRLGSLAGGTAPVLVENASNGVFAEGHLLFEPRGGGLVAQPFDSATGKLSGTPVTLTREILNGMGVSLLPLSASSTGDLVYLSRPTSWKGALGWYDRSGNQLGTVGEPAAWTAARLSPDGRKVAVALTDTSTEPYRTDLWTVDLATGNRSRLSFEEGDVDTPAWSPDGKRIAYARYFGGRSILAVRSAGGGREDLLLEESRLDNVALDWSPDGQSLAYGIFDAAKGNYDIWLLNVAGKSAHALLDTGADEVAPRFSPDGRFLLYVTNESGTFQLFLRRLADGEKWQVSVDGGDYPRWTRGGREIYFLGSDNRPRIVEVVLGDAVALGPPALPADAKEFPVTRWFYLEPTADGGRILADAPPAENLDSKFRLILNWPALLPR